MLHFLQHCRSIHTYIHTSHASGLFLVSVFGDVIEVWVIVPCIVSYDGAAENNRET